MNLKRVEHAARVFVRRSPFAPALRRLLRPTPLDPAIAVGRARGWEAAARWLLTPEGRGVLADFSWQEPLRRGINTEIERELLLTTVRRELLLSSVAWDKDDHLVRLVGTIAKQCFNNEFVWRVSAEEHEALHVGLDRSGAGATWQRFVLASLYERVRRILARPGNPWKLAEVLPALPADLRGIVERRIAETDELASHRAAVRGFGSLADEPDDPVAAMYEEYPYPRWVETEMPEAGSRRRKIAHLAGPDSPLADQSRPLDVLVAGCGTGSLAIEHGAGFGANARILGVDISRTSLAYATMMARRFGTENVEFLRMDLLELPDLGRQFDVIECTGVLHHLADPVAGARALARVLRPGGLAHISVYSELGRDEVVRQRRHHEHRIAEVTDDEVREFRWRLMLDDPAAIERRLCLRADFFSLPRSRDLLFHPRERRYSLPEVGELLEGGGLRFLHLERPDVPWHRAWVRYPPRGRERDLSAWHEFETRYPDAFWYLYQVWATRA